MRRRTGIIVVVGGARAALGWGGALQDGVAGGLHAVRLWGVVCRGAGRALHAAQPHSLRSTPLQLGVAHGHRHRHDARAAIARRGARIMAGWIRLVRVG